MRTFLSAFCAIALLVGVAAPAVAAPSKPKIQRFNLTGSEIEGALITPDGKWLYARPKVVHKSLIDYRVDFNDIMAKLIDEL